MYQISAQWLKIKSQKILQIISETKTVLIIIFTKPITLKPR